MAHNSVDYFYYLDHLPRYSVPSYHPILWGQVCLLKLSLRIEESVSYARRYGGKGPEGRGASNGWPVPRSGLDQSEYPPGAPGLDPGLVRVCMTDDPQADLHGGNRTTVFLEMGG